MIVYAHSFGIENSRRRTYAHRVLVKHADSRDVLFDTLDQPTYHRAATLVEAWCRDHGATLVPKPKE